MLPPNREVTRTSARSGSLLRPDRRLDFLYLASAEATMTEAGDSSSATSSPAVS